MNNPRRLQAVCLDAFGTVCRIDDPTHPYARLFRHLQLDAQQAGLLALTRSLGFGELVELLASQTTVDLELYLDDLRREVVSVRLFDDVVPALARLRTLGLKLWVISNLAAPYAVALRERLDGLIDGYSLSCEVGAIKPQREIFAHPCRGLGLEAGQMLMVGNSRRADVAGAEGFGMSAVLIARGDNVHAEVCRDLRQVVALVEQRLNG